MLHLKKRETHDVTTTFTWVFSMGLSVKMAYRNEVREEIRQKLGLTDNKTVDICGQVLGRRQLHREGDPDISKESSWFLGQTRSCTHGWRDSRKLTEDSGISQSVQTSENSAEDS